MFNISFSIKLLDLIILRTWFKLFIENLLMFILRKYSNNLSLGGDVVSSQKLYYFIFLAL